MDGAGYQSPSEKCLLNTFGTSVLTESSHCCSGERVQNMVSKLMTGKFERETFALILKKKSTESLPLLYTSGTNCEHTYGTYPNLPFPERIDCWRKDRILPPRNCYEALTFDMGLVHYQVGNLQEALTCFAIALSTTLDLTIKTACFNNICTIRCYLKHPMDDCHVHATKTFLHQELANPDAHKSELLARTLLTDGFIEYTRCNFDIALECCQSALLLPSYSERSHACLLYNIGLLQFHLQNWSSSLDHFKDFVKICKSSGLCLATALFYIGVVHRNQGDLRCSFGYLVQSATLEPQSSETWHAIATVLHDSDDLENALNAYQEALRFTRDDSFTAAKILMDIGRLHHILCSMDESVDAYRRALSITQKLFGETSPYSAKLLHIIGILCVEQGKIDEAMISFALAQRIIPNEIVIHYGLPCPRDRHAACA